MKVVMRCRLRTAGTTVLFIALAASMSLVLADGTDTTQAWPEELADALRNALSVQDDRSVHNSDIVLEAGVLSVMQARTRSHASSFDETSLATNVRLQGFAGLTDFSQSRADRHRSALH